MSTLVERPLAAVSADQLQRTYALLQRCIAPDELIDVDVLVDVYVTSQRPQPSVVVLRGEEPVAVMLGEWSVSGQVLLLAYVAVVGGARNGGLGTRLVGSVLPDWARASPGCLVLAEVEDPRRHASDVDRGDPAARLRFYERLDARLLPVPFVQPALRPPATSRVPGLLLLRLDAGDTLPDGVLESFVREYYSDCEGEPSLADPEVRSLLAAVARLHGPEDVWSLSRLDELPVPQATRASAAAGGP